MGMPCRIKQIRCRGRPSVSAAAPLDKTFFKRVRIMHQIPLARISHQVSLRNGEDACRYKAREVRAGKTGTATFLRKGSELFPCR